MIGGQFDSLLAKVIVTGADRTQALERSRRALDEMVVEGMATVLPFHRAIVRDPAYVGDGTTTFSVHTRWIETEFDNQIAPFADRRRGRRSRSRGRRVVVEVGGRRLEVSLPGGLAAGAPAASGPAGEGPAAQARRGQVRDGLRRRGGRADAGHDRQDRGRGRPAGRAG